jgi:hypothetical protein
MTRKRARITDENNPLTSTDEILAGFQQVNKSKSQQSEISNLKQFNKLKSQL